MSTVQWIVNLSDALALYFFSLVAFGAAMQATNKNWNKSFGIGLAMSIVSYFFLGLFMFVPICLYLGTYYIFEYVSMKLGK